MDRDTVGDTQVRITFRRATGNYGRLRRLKVLIDGQAALELKHEDEQAIALTPGEHTVRTKMDWGTSPELLINARDGLVVRCGVQPFFKALLFTFIAPRRLFTATADERSVGD